jgi:tripartite-type tricarboxylate transporter receptor subunit TctC
MRTLRLSLLVIAIAVACSTALAQAPRAQARMLVGFPPGGNIDILGRIFAERWSEATGRPVVVETRAGASGQIGAEALKHAAADGNTLLTSPDASMIVNPQTSRKPLYDTLKDFVGVSLIGEVGLALVVNANLPVKNLQDYVNWVKSNPANASCSNPGAGGTVHFFGLLMAQELGLKLTPVPYKGGGPSLADLVAGHAPASVQPMGALVPLAKSGKARILAITGDRRTPSASDVPTFAEQGYPSINVKTWYGIFAPAATPPDAVGRLNGMFVQALRNQAVADRLRSMDMEIREMSVPDFAALIKSDYERWTPIIKASGFTADFD